MNEFADVVECFVRMADEFANGLATPHSPLEEILLRTSGGDFAYVDNRRDAMKKHGYDFWHGVDKDRLQAQGLGKTILYSESQRFPDFLFKARTRDGKLTCGSLLELKDSKSGSISSFNSTLPTKRKNLREVDVVNGGNLVSKVAAILDGSLAAVEGYYEYERNCFYLVRTNSGDDKVKISIVQGSFFETVPKEHLFYQMFLNVLRSHLEKGKVELPSEVLTALEQALSHIKDQTIIAASQIIEGASVRPRLRVMAEVHPEGNPHSSHYPMISERTFNLIVQATPYVEAVKAYIADRSPRIEAFPVHHKRNGRHTVFQLRL